VAIKPVPLPLIEVVIVPLTPVVDETTFDSAATVQTPVAWSKFE
jgi:hypothetical protein